MANATKTPLHLITVLLISNVIKMHRVEQAVMWGESTPVPSRRGVKSWARQNVKADVSVLVTVSLTECWTEPAQLKSTMSQVNSEELWRLCRARSTA